eukprot:3339356-Prymnesium_polylepis.1
MISCEEEDDQFPHHAVAKHAYAPLAPRLRRHGGGAAAGRMRRRESPGPVDQPRHRAGDHRAALHGGSRRAAATCVQAARVCRTAGGRRREWRGRYGGAEPDLARARLFRHAAPLRLRVQD